MYHAGKVTTAATPVTARTTPVHFGAGPRHVRIPNPTNAARQGQRTYQEGNVERPALARRLLDVDERADDSHQTRPKSPEHGQQTKDDRGGGATSRLETSHRAAPQAERDSHDDEADAH
jgi:hypothetical protein